MSYRISVLISTYDNRRFVEKKLVEIGRQTIFDQAEFIFVVTASPGHERNLLSPFCAGHPNCRLLALDERKTLYEAWNLGWDAATAPLVCNSNMDDAMHPRLLETVADTMERRPWDVCRS
jgi:GT2 family glycosyltransferase